MRSLVVGFLVVLLGCAVPGASSPVHPWDLCSESREVTHPSVVVLRNELGRCTGVVVASDQVLTSAHCVEGKEDVWVERAGKIFPGRKIVSRGPNHEDIALVYLDPQFRGAYLEIGEAHRGDVVQTIGYGCDQQHTRQLMRRALYTGEGDRYIGCACKGDSGSPVINSRGELVAVTWGVADTFFEAPNAHLLYYLQGL